MICPKCNTPNPDSATNCSYCAFSFYHPGNNPALTFVQPQIRTESERTVKLLLYFIGWVVIALLGSQIIRYGIEPLLKEIYGDGSRYWKRVTFVYSLDGWIINLGSLAIGVVMLVKVKNTTAKWLFAGYLLFWTIELIAMRIAPLFAPDPLPFVNFNF